MSWWEAISNAVQDVGREASSVVSSLESTASSAVHGDWDQVGRDIVHDTHDLVGEVSNSLNSVGDALQSMDEAIESVPIVSTLYDFTPMHTAAHLGSEWAHVGGELAGDVGSEMEGHHADWGHLGRQALKAGADTAITIAASEIGGAGAGKILGKVAGSAERAGMKALGRDVAGDIGAGGARSTGRWIADRLAYNTVKGVTGGLGSAPLTAGARGAGIRWDDRPYQGRMSSGRVGQGSINTPGGNLALRDASRGSGAPTSEKRSEARDDWEGSLYGGLDTTNVRHVVETVDNTPPVFSYGDLMNYNKARELGQDTHGMPSNALFRPPDESYFRSAPSTGGFRQLSTADMFQG